jgi:signal transduction histidine kinase/DNA-binding response OmpR family regulator
LAQGATVDNKSWRQWWELQEDTAGPAELPLVHFRRVFERFGTYGSVIFCLVITMLVVVIRQKWLLSSWHWYVTDLDMWGMIVIVLTWPLLSLWLLHHSRRIPFGVTSLVAVIYWSLAITCSNVPADIASGAVVIYYGIMVMTASLLLPSWSCLVLAVVYGLIMFVCGWIAHVQIRLFDIAGLTLAGLFSWLTGNLLEASYFSLHQLTSSLRESNQSLAEENRQRAKLETDLRCAVAEAEKANILKSRFLANMSHEIRTPLTSIIGFTGLLQKSKMEPEQQEYLETVRRSSELLLRLINDILDISKIESQQLVLEKIDFDLEYVINSVAAIIREKLRGKPVVLRLEYPAALPRRFLGDPTRIRQIFLNLLSNAAKFTFTGEVVVAVAEEPAGKAEEGGHAHALRLTVRDTGIGIAPEHQQDIFKAFVQGDGSTTRKYGGTGLGLTITRELVEHMGGTVSLVSEIGRGSAFTVRLRLPAGRQASGKAFSLPTVRELKGLGVLLIEGDAGNRQWLERYLLSLELRIAQVLTRTDEAPAWLDLHASEIALVLCDTQFLQADGEAFARALNRRADREKFKIIALNADALPGNSRLALAAGFDGYLSKPISSTELLSVLQGVLGDRRLEKDPIVNRHLMREYALRNLSVLVAEDNEINRQLLVALLAKMECRVVATPNGREALAALRSQPFDLLLLDIQMPEMDGLEIAGEIRRNLGLKLPIIALTANALETVRADCLRAGMNDFLTKPIDVELLKEKIAEWTQRG